MPMIQLPKDIDVDAFVIQEQAEHLLIAMRIPRNTITANHSFLTALAERAGAPPIGAAIWRRRSIHLLRYAACAVAGAFLFGLALHIPSPLLADEPITVLGAAVDNPVVHGGDKLTIRFHVHRKRVCETDVERLILNADGVKVYADRQSGLGADVSPAPVWHAILVPIPTDLPPGRYRYRSISFSRCEGQVFVGTKPDIPFEVVARSL